MIGAICCQCRERDLVQFMDFDRCRQNIDAQAVFLVKITSRVWTLNARSVGLRRLLFARKERPGLHQSIYSDVKAYM